MRPRTIAVLLATLLLGGCFVRHSNYRRPGHVEKCEDRGGKHCHGRGHDHDHDRGHGHDGDHDRD
ncbi:MAG: hypothetical protein K8W52_06035 [Deltaproteobacteria bacterium]|nr:hypothetical protein [Deltaproteobacteria bacterium]